MTTHTPAPLTLRSPEDLLALVPVVLGFHPEDSIVLVALGRRDDGRAGPHARVDLPPDAADEESRRQVADLLLSACVTHGVARVALVAYSDDACAGGAMVATLGGALTEAGVEVVVAVRADGDCWWLLDEDGEAEPGREGTAYDIESHAITAEGVWSGRVVHPCRSALAESLDVHDLDICDEVGDAALACEEAMRAGECDLGVGADADSGARREAARWVDASVRRWTGERSTPTPEELGRLVVLFEDVVLRDFAWATMTAESASLHVELWTWAVRHTPVERRSAVSALLAFAAWLDGDGALAWTALDRCLESDPDYSMGLLLGDILQSAMPPSAWTAPPSPIVA